MMNETIDRDVRGDCAKALLSAENGYIRSIAFWFYRYGRMSELTKMWWVKFNS